MKEIITLHLGQTGVQVADPLWRLMSTEHNIAIDGTQLPCPNDWDFSPISEMCPEILIGIDCKKTNGNYEPIFQETRDGKFYGRSVLIDPDPETIASMMRPRICERIRRMLEECDLPEGFIIINSLGGGTGSGLTAALLNTLRIYYKNLVQLQVTLFPTPQATTVEPYNCALHEYKMNDNSCIMLIDNQALFNALTPMRRSSNGFEAVNNIIAQLVSNLTIGTRFKEISEGLISLRDLRFLLHPTKNLRYSSFSYSPFTSKKTYRYDKWYEHELTIDCFTEINQLINCPNIEKTPNLGTCMIYRGNLNYFKAKECAGNYLRQLNGGLQTGVNVCVSQKNTYHLDENNMPKAGNTACKLSTNLALKNIWEKTYNNYTTLLQKRAFLHWYENERMTSCDFDGAKEKLCILLDEYNFMLKK
ncbi:uncharacterized protein isoform X2 [Rhodnius prolixus]|uniref:uncharacterized protein isoform X2 n=1 Tax=Rhodnius prolixus TaxID=13249 RepID=UPI003D18F47D